MEKITWAPKVHQSKIWQLCQDDALEGADETLVADVGYGLLQRCRSIRLVTRCEVECPRCGKVFQLAESEAWSLLPGTQVCPMPGCGWETSAETWRAEVGRMFRRRRGLE